MTLEQIKNMVDSDAYCFLRENPHLGNNVAFLTLGGSHAYGTNAETSDVDIRGCALNSKSDILGLTNFEQFINEETDTVVYGFNKLIGLLLNCNPNVIEMLGCKKEHYFLVTDIGQEMIDNRKLFLSQRAVNSFGGYATQQLRRLENALARDKLPHAKREEHVLKSMQNAAITFQDAYSKLGENGIRLYVEKSDRDDMDVEIFADINLEKFPARDFNSILNNLANVMRSYDKMNGRNRKKDDAHLNKHAMHLIRLYLMCLDILEKEEIITYRENDIQLLMSIRGGEYQMEDGLYRPEFFDMVADFEKRLDYAKKNTSLPKSPNMKLVEEFVIGVNERSTHGRD